MEAYEESNMRSMDILEQEVLGRKGYSTIFETTFKEPLHMGAEFKLIEECKGSLHIERSTATGAGFLNLRQSSSRPDGYFFFIRLS